MFKFHSDYKPTGDQPQAIEYLSKGIEEGKKFQTLLGVTGSGKTFTMANIIEKVNRPTLILAHNKTLAAQLCSEFKEFFPNNAVEYFVSYYDYYQPEAYVPSSDTYIAKDSARNDEIDKLRLSATSALSERNDVIVVSSVSCIYGIGSPKDYMEMIISLRPGMEKDRDDVITPTRYMVMILESGMIWISTAVRSACAVMYWRFFRRGRRTRRCASSSSGMRLTVWCRSIR